MHCTWANESFIILLRDSSACALYLSKQILYTNVCQQILYTNVWQVWHVKESKEPYISMSIAGAIDSYHIGLSVLNDCEVFINDSRLKLSSGF